MTEGCSTSAPRCRVARFRARAAEAASRRVPLRVLVSNGSDTGYVDADVTRFVLACAVLAVRVASDYGFPAPILQFVAVGTPMPAPLPGVVDAWIHLVLRVDPPGAQGYHEDGPGGPDGYVSVAGVDVDGLTETLCHEILEAIGNPFLDAIVVGPSGTRHMRELCDVVQAKDNATRLPVDLHDGHPPVMGANYVTPAYWQWEATHAEGTRFDALGVLAGPLPTIGPYGYAAVTQPDGTTTDVYGVGDAPFDLPSEKRHPEARIQVVLASLRASAWRP